MKYVKRKPNEPPIVPYWIPVIGSAITMGMDPIKFYRKYQQEVRFCFIKLILVLTFLIK
jgi:hypothetical protein